MCAATWESRQCQRTSRRVCASTRAVSAAPLVAGANTLYAWSATSRYSRTIFVHPWLRPYPYGGTWVDSNRSTSAPTDSCGSPPGDVVSTTAPLPGRRFLLALGTIKPLARRTLRSTDHTTSMPDAGGASSPTRALLFTAVFKLPQWSPKQDLMCFSTIRSASSAFPDAAMAAAKRRREKRRRPVGV